MNEDDKWDGFPLPTRTGVAQGKSFENRMLSNAPSIGTKMRTFDNGSGQTSVLMRTRAGMPEFITTVDQFVPQVDPCVKGHFIEGPIENRVVFEPNEGDDSNVRVFSTDYIFSRLRKLAKELKGIVAGRQFKFHLTQDGEGIASGTPKRFSPVESASRTYHPAIVGYEEPAEEVDGGESKGIHYELHRFKDVTFKFSASGKPAKYTFANVEYLEAVPTSIGCMNKNASELGINVPARDRTEFDILKEVTLKNQNGKAIVLEFSGGFPESFPPLEAGEENKRLKIVDEDDFEAFDLSKMANYGQAWHGKLDSTGVHTTVDGVPTVVTPKGYIAPTTGDVHYVRSPLAVAREATFPPVTDPVLLAQGAVFNDYALLFGVDKRYSTTAGWNIGANNFIHFDSTGFARVLGIEATATNTSCTITLKYRKSLWDIDPDDDPYSAGQTLATATVAVDLFVSALMYSGNVYAGFRINASPSGDRVAVMLTAYCGRLDMLSYYDACPIAEVVEVTIQSNLSSVSLSSVWRMTYVEEYTPIPTKTAFRAYSHREYTGTEDLGGGQVRHYYTDYVRDWGTSYPLTANPFSRIDETITWTMVACARYSVAGALVLDVVVWTSTQNYAKSTWDELHAHNAGYWTTPLSSEPDLPPKCNAQGGPYGCWSATSVGPHGESLSTTPASWAVSTVYCGQTVFTFNNTTGYPPIKDGMLKSLPIHINNNVSKIVRTYSGENPICLVGGGRIASEVKTYASYNPATDELAVSDTPIAFS